VNIQDAWKIWQGEKPDDAPTTEKTPETPKTYTRGAQLFDAAQWEAEYGDADKKQWYFALCERLLEALKHD